MSEPEFQTEPQPEFQTEPPPPPPPPPPRPRPQPPQPQSRPDQGLSLLDLGPLYELVPIGPERKNLKVLGVSAKGIFSIFQRYPEIMNWFKGGQANLNLLIAQAPGAMAAIIAAGCGLDGNEIAEEHASLLPVEAQLDILEAIGRLTFKNGFGPFVQRIVALSVAAKSQNYGRALGTISPQASKPVSPPATTPNPSGT